MKVYATLGMTLAFGLAIWLGVDYLLTGFGKPFGMGVCAGVMLSFSLMWFGGLWSESAKRRDRERRRVLTPTRRAE